VADVVKFEVADGSTLKPLGKRRSGRRRNKGKGESHLSTAAGSRQTDKTAPQSDANGLGLIGKKSKVELPPKAGTRKSEAKAEMDRCDPALALDMCDEDSSESDDDVPKKCVRCQQIRPPEAFTDGRKCDVCKEEGWIICRGKNYTCMQWVIGEIQGGYCAACGGKKDWDKRVQENRKTRAAELAELHQSYSRGGGADHN
jgi:hypothetical protein